MNGVAGTRDSSELASLTWPPPADYPIVRDATGNIVCRYGDVDWNLTAWNGKRLIIKFGESSSRGRAISPPNAQVRRKICAWWMFGPSGCHRARTLSERHAIMKPLFVACTDSGICATELRKYPKVIEKVAALLSPSQGNNVLALLSDLFACRMLLGFVILDEPGLSLLASLIQPRASSQTAYIPPRIWSYQVKRLREFLDDFHAHHKQVSDCYRFCLDAYAANRDAGLTTWPKMNNRSPFAVATKSMNGCVYHGPFRMVARRFGIEELLERWVSNSPDFRVARLSSYMSLASKVGLLYTLNFSLMRLGEGSGLRSDCFVVERDSLGDDICYVRGTTSKTVQDDEAHWIVSPTVQIAIDAMVRIAELRMEARSLDSSISLPDGELRTPILQTRPFEPWAPSAFDMAHSKNDQSYGLIVSSWPKLFDEEQLRITDEDHRIARQFTFNLDPKRFAVGKVWPLACHQLRRTGAVNMLASGMVSDASLQYQLKHANRAMSRYYGQNYHRVHATLDDETRGFYLREMYSTLVREFTELQSDRFVSPHGERRKVHILSAISDKDHSSLLRDARAGRISYRENFMGGCAKPGTPCELGGISNVSGCMGYGAMNPCEHLLLSKEKRPILIKLLDRATGNLSVAPPDSMLSLSLKSQLESIERALNVIDRS